MTIKVKFADVQQLTRSRTSSVPVSSRAALARISRDLLEGFFPPAKAVRLLGVTVSGFDSADGERTNQVNLDFG